MNKRTTRDKLALLSLRIPHFLIILSSSILLTSCGDDETGKLRNYIKEVKSRKASDIEPIPNIQQYSSFEYTVEKNRRSPFIPFRQLTGSSETPDQNREKEPLEAYPLDSLQMLGTLVRNKKVWAVIMTPDGMVHSIAVGDYVGLDYGQVKEITENAVNLIETVQQDGDWVHRSASLSVKENVL